jgi:hypothetical protein
MNYHRVKHLFIGLTGMAIWFAAFRFSVNGFSFEMREWEWVGYVFGFGVTALELAFSSEISNRGTNFTIYMAGVASYVYGITTNVIGIWIAKGNSDLSGLLDPNNFVEIVFVLIVAIIGEVAPEAMVVFALGIDNLNGEGDFLKNISRGLFEGKSTPRSAPRQEPQKQTPPAVKLTPKPGGQGRPSNGKPQQMQMPPRMVREEDD